MPREIGLDEIRQLIDRGGQVVDVLPEAEYEQEHIAGAINIPLKKMTLEAVSILDANRPVITYCHDYQ
jgi:rhodanese-related sulfurtransferase